MNEDIPISVRREDIIEAFARGAQRAIEAADVMNRFGDLLELLAGMQLLKEDTLTVPQAARLLGISQRTFERQMNEEGLWTKIEALGRSEPRVSFRQIAQVLKEAGNKTNLRRQASDLDTARLRDVASAAVIGEHKPRRRVKAATQN